MTSRGWTDLVFLPYLSAEPRVVREAGIKVNEVEIEELQEIEGVGDDEGEE